MTDQVLDHPCVRPGQQRVEVFSLTSHLLVELVVALRCKDDHRPLLVLNDVADVGRQPAEFAIADELAVADTQGPQQLGRSLIDIHSGRHQRTKEVAFAGFIRADVWLVLGRRLGRRRLGRACRWTLRGSGLPDPFHDGHRVVEGRRVSGDDQLAGPVHDRRRLTRPVHELHPPGFVGTGRKLNASYGLELLLKMFLVALWDGVGRGWARFAREQFEVHNSRLLYVPPSPRCGGIRFFPTMAEVVRVVAADDPVRALFSPAGELTADARSRLGLDAAALRELYRNMVLIRRADQEALNLQRQGELGLWGQYLGQEAIHVGAMTALRTEDWVFPSYREFGMAMIRGIDPADMLTLFRGLSHGPWDPRKYHFAPLAIPVATQVPHAVGFAMGCRLKHTDEVVLSTFGDGATSEGDWHEAMNFAGVFKAPVVFLCQNNYWAISVPLSKQTAGSIAERAQGYGFPGLRIDGNDVLGVYAAVRAAAARARQGDGPYLIEAVTYRMGAHTSSDDPTRYRPDSELQAWNAKDPIARYQAWLEQQGIIDEGTVAAIADAAESAAQAMRTRLQ